MPIFNWFVSQIGAREHYAVPRAFYLKNHLHTFYTDAWCRYGAKILRGGSKLTHSFAGRFHQNLPSDKVVSFTLRTLWEQLCSSFKSNYQVTEKYLEYIRIGSSFAKNVNRHLSKQIFDPKCDFFFGFNTGCQETLEFLSGKGILTIVDQIDPAKVEEELVLEEIKKWPGWQILTGRIPDIYYERLNNEWHTASLVLVNSNWSKKALVRQGVPVEKIIVVPLAYEPNKQYVKIKANLDMPLTVLWLGSVILRKGIQYLIEAARLLVSTNIKFIVGGPIGITKEAIASAPKNVTFVGRVTRDQTSDIYRQADIFVLPTISDGFAITQLEAMAHALPVITTQNCGDVVTGGIDGLIVPTCESMALARAISKFDQDRGMLQEMSQQALEKSKMFSLKHYVERLESEVTTFCAKYR